MAIITATGYSFGSDENYTRTFYQEASSEIIGVGTEGLYTRNYYLQDVDTIIRQQTEVGYASSTSETRIFPIYNNIRFTGVSTVASTRPTAGLLYPRKDGLVSSIYNTVSIVTSGLILNLDAFSYSGIGTIWTDSSGNGNNGTLTGGPNYSSENSGSIVFDGVNDLVTASSSNIFNNFSYDIWCLPEATHEIDAESAFNTTGTSGQKYIIGANNLYENTSNSGSGISVGTNGISVYEHGPAYMPPLLVYSGTINSPVHIVVIYTNKVPSLYLNGTFIKNGLTSPKANVQITTYSIGGMAYGYFRGKLYAAKFYSRSLTAAEVLQNFNALKRRFNIYI